MSNNERDSSINPETVAGYIDHTILKPTATEEDITKLCREAAENRFKAVCINPVFVHLAAEALRGTAVSVCTVIGFPLGANMSAVKANEARQAVLAGVREVDMVIWLGALKEGRDEDVERDIGEVVRAAQDVNPDAVVKVIIETCYLTDEEKVRACRLAEAAGAHFVKTSTGFGPSGATVDDVTLMRKSVGLNVSVKAAGGIRTAAQALEFIKAGADRLGTSSGVAILEELRRGN